MERGVEVNDVPTAVLDDEEAVQQSKRRGVGTVNQSIAAISPLWFRKSAPIALVGRAPLGAAANTETQ